MIQFEYPDNIDKPINYEQNEKEYLELFKDINEKYPNDETVLKWNGSKYDIHTNLELAMFFRVMDNDNTLQFPK